MLEYVGSSFGVLMGKIVSLVLITALAYWLMAMGGMKLVSAAVKDSGLGGLHKKEKRAAHVDSARSALWRNNAGVTEEQVNDQ